MPLGMEVGLGPRHIVLDGDPAPPNKGHSTPPPIFNPCLLWSKGCMDQYTIWLGGRPEPRPHCVRWGAISPIPLKRGTAPHFSAHVYCGQTAAWIKMPLGMKVGLGPGNIVLDVDPAPPAPKGQSTRQSWPMSIVVKRLDGLGCHLVWR